MPITPPYPKLNTISLDMRPLTPEMRDKMAESFKRSREDHRPRLLIVHPETAKLLRANDHPTRL